MASLTSIRNGIGTNLGNISSLTVSNFVPDFVEPPIAVVGVVETWVWYYNTRGADKYEIPIFIYIRVDTQDSQETLDGYLASTGLVLKAQIEYDALGGAAILVEQLNQKKLACILSIA